MQEIKTTNFSLKCINRVGVLINNTPAIHFHYKFEFILCKNWLYQNCLCNNKVVPKTVVENFSFTQDSPKFSVTVFNVGGCLASCLTFRSFLTLDP